MSGKVSLVVLKLNSLLERKGREAEEDRRRREEEDAEEERG